MAIPKWKSLQQSADRARKGAEHAKAVGIYKKALAQKNLPWEAFVELSVARAYCHKMLNQLIEADACLTELAEKASQRGDNETVVRAYAELLFVLRKSGDFKRGLEVGQESLNIARQTSQPDLIADALLSLAVIHTEIGEEQQAQVCLSEAQTLIKLEDKLKQLKAYFINDYILGVSGKLEEFEKSVAQALDIARKIGDKDWEGIFLNQHAVYTLDFALRRTLYDQALVAFEAAGDYAYQAIVRFNKGALDVELGLYKSAIATLKPLLEEDRELEHEAVCMNELIYLGMISFFTHDLPSAYAHTQEGIALARKTGAVVMEYIFQSVLNLFYLANEQPAEALDALETANTLPYQQRPEDRLTNLAARALVNHALGNFSTADKEAKQVINTLRTVEDSFYQRIDLDIFSWFCYLALHAQKPSGRKTKTISQKAWQALELGLKGVFLPIKNMSDAGLRRGYFHREFMHRLLIKEWLKYAYSRGMGAERIKEFTERVQKPGRLDEVFHRLLTVGVRLNAERDPTRLPEKIVEQVDELTGAERIALILLDDRREQRLVKTVLPQPAYPVFCSTVEPQPDPDAFVKEIEPFLEEAMVSKQGFIRQINPEATLLEQRSVLVAPLLSQGRLTGIIYTDITGCFGRFDLEDLNLLGVLANQSAVALDNANWSATLEQKVTDRTAQLKHTNDHLEQRTAELTILNSVGEAMARTLDVKTVIRIVGDKVRDIFNADQASISLVDFQNNLISREYSYDVGEGGYVDYLAPTFPLGLGMTSEIIFNKQPLLLGTSAEQTAHGAYIPAESLEHSIIGKVTESFIGVPIIVNEQVLGVVSLSDYDQNAYTQENLQLLQTLAANMGVAIANARLFQAEQERVNELQIINSIQQGLAAELDFQSIVDLVGDKLREVFRTPDLGVNWYEEKTGLLHQMYTYEHDQRLYFPPSKPTVTGPFLRMSKSHQPVVWNTAEEGDVLTGGVVPGTDRSLSGVMIPIISKNTMLGTIQLENYEREYAFGETQIRLLTTIAASLGSALENARLFDETQRLFKAEQERVAELQIINSIQQGLAAELNFQAIIDLVGDKLLEVLHTQDLGIRWYDEKANLLHYLYNVEHGDRLSIDPMQPMPGGIFEQIYKSRRPLIGNTVDDLYQYSQTIPGTSVAKSNISVPIISSDKVLGIITIENYEKEYAFGEAEERLLTTIAASLGTALENARLFDETQRLLKETEQRAAELAILNSVGEAMSRQLDTKTITRLVGDKVREIFNAECVLIFLYDRATNWLFPPYVYDRGYIDSEKSEFFTKNAMEDPLFNPIILERKSVNLGTAKEMEDLGGRFFPDAEGSGGITNSFMGVPIIVGEQVRGLVSVQSYRKHAYDETNLRLLSTLASSMGVAIENARLFQETQRLLDETQQRNNELAIINSVQAALAAELNIQGIYDAVGDKIREIFHSDNVEIRIFDHKAKLDWTPYLYEKGMRLEIDPIPLQEAGFSAQVIKTHQTIVINENLLEEGKKLGSHVVQGTEAALSVVYVPIITGDQVRGVVGLSDFEHEHAFSESDVRLLQTLVNSMSVALENARLFDETQHLLKETEQRNAELAILNSVSQAMSRQLDVNAIIKIVGDQVRDTFKSEVTTIHFYEAKSNLVTCAYAYDRGYLDLPPLAYGEGLTSRVISTREPLILLNALEDKELGSLLVPNAIGEEGVTKSYLGVPIITGDNVIGVVSVQSYQENAYQPSHISLLSTLASSMGVAIANARLFQAEQERVSELQIINSIQQGLAAELDFQAIVDLVGDKLREVFKTGDLGITWLDSQTNLVNYLYTYEHGKRIFAPPMPPIPGGVYETLMETRQPLVMGVADMNKSILMPGTDRSLSEVCVPIISSDRFLGDIFIENFERENAFGEAEIRLLTTIAASLGTALENARLFDETQRLLRETEQRAAELAILNSVGDAMAKQLDIKTITHLVGDKVREIFASECVFISLYDWQTNNLHPAFVYDKGYVDTEKTDEYDRNVFTDPIFKAIIIDRKSLLYGTGKDLIDAGADVWPDAEGGEGLTNSFMGVPIIVGEQVRGLVSVQSYKEHIYDETNLRLLSTLASSMGVAIENARLFEETQRLLNETQQRNSELAIINSVQAALAAELDIQGIYNAVGDKIREIFHTGNVDIRIYDPKTNIVSFPYEYEEGIRVQLQSGPLPEKGFGAHVLRTRETLVINENMEQALEQYGSYIIPGTLPDKSNVWVPLVVGDQSRGLICLSDYQHEHAFSDTDVRLLQTLANSMSVALENARLFAETQRLLEETSQRASELTIINRVSQAMSTQMEVKAIVHTVGDQVRDTLRSEVVNIYLFDPIEKMIHLPYSYDRKYVVSESFPYGSGLTSKVIDSKQPLILRSFEEIQSQGALLSPNAPDDELMPQSYLGVPIVVGEKAIGVIDVQSYKECVYDDSHVRLLTTLASSMGVALENARLFEETRRLLAVTEQRNRELAIISRIGQALVGQLDPQGIYELVGGELQQVFDAQVVAIITYDRQENIATWRYSIEKGQRQTVSPRPPAGFSGHILRTRQPLLIAHDVDKRAAELGSKVLAGEATKSYLGVPLIAGGEVTGVITLQNIDREEAFNENDLRLLSTLALSMGVALENARLYQETQHHAVEMATLAEIGSDIASTHEMEPVLERMATKTRELMEVRDISMYLLQPDGHTLKPIVSQGKYAAEIKAQSISLGLGLTGNVVKKGEAEIINEPERDPRAVHIPGTAADEEENECIMIAPLISRGKPIGAMSVYRDRDQGLFTQLELDFLVSLARQAAIAIESARLYAETERRATEMAALAEVSREISATLELQVVLERIAGQACELLSAGNSAVYLLQPDGHSIKAIVAEGDIAQEVLADEVQLGNGIIGSIVLSGVAEWIDDTAKDARAVQIRGTQDIAEGEKLLVAPLLTQDRSIGALAVWRDPDDPRFNQAELSFAISLAQQAVVAIENARLFESAQESQRQMADIIDFLPDSTLVIDRQGKVIAWNHAIEEMTGVKAEDMVGKGDYEYALPFYGERRPILIDMVLMPNEEIEAKYTHIQRSEDILVGEAIARLKGQATYLNATASALKNSKGEAVGAIESIRDVTDQKQAEQELHQAKLEAEQANQAKSAFLAMMSHEIRTPMNAIIGMSGLLMDTPLNADQREFAETIRSSGDSLLNIINDILDFSKIEAGKMSLEEQPFDLRECIESSLDLIKVRASEKGLELAYQMDPEVPSAILGDVTRLRQVMINLLGNSVKFTEQGEIVLSVTRGDQADSLHFMVCDTGIGIAPERGSQLFRPFTQADATTSRRYGGTGLGLALSSRIVDLMGGRIWVESEGIPGKGSIFHFIISAKPALDWKGRPQLQGEQPQLRGRGVLIVDDNATNRRILELQTRSWGMVPKECATPAEALELLQKGEKFDLAILDMHMPEMSGLDLAEQIRKLESSRPVEARMPLVLSTSLGGREEARESTEFAAILMKPIRQSALFDMLITLFGRQQPVSPKPQPERSALDPEMAAHHPLHILLAEDNVINQKLALRLLSQMGYRADIAANGLEVLQAVKRQPYDVILMDVQMPEMDGLEATRRLCTELPAEKRPHIVAMTANAMQGDREMCLEAGMDDYLSKPIRVDELVTALKLAQPKASG